MRSRAERVGLWMIGACGGVGSTVALGVAALAKDLTATNGLVSELRPFASAGLVEPGSIVIGGHEIRPTTLPEAVEKMHARAGLFDRALMRACTPKLRSMQRNIRPGSVLGDARTTNRGHREQNLAWGDVHGRDASATAAVERLSGDMKAFWRKHRLDRVVVVYLGPSEPAPKRVAAHARYDRLAKAMGRRGGCDLATSSLYALAAIEAGCAFVNFTPSPGICVPAVEERAKKVGIAYMGNDGKTGETLVKSALAPMFAMRHLEVLSWVGQNILGNRDGEALRDPATRQAKILSKDKVVSQIMGQPVTTHVSIDYVPSLDDWKVAWDFIHFRGFLGTRMNMQFTWQASDSILAAPLVIDLVRFAALACRAGRGGPMRHLAFFFKDPIGVREHNLYLQWEELVRHVARGCVSMEGTEG